MFYTERVQIPALDALHAAAHRYLPPPLREFVKFGITGSVGFVVDFGVFLTLTRLVGWRTVYLLLGYELIAANLVSVLTAIIAVFLLNKFWTFRDPRADVMVRQGSRFFLLYFVTYVLNQVLTSFFAFRVPVLGAIFGENVDIVAKIIAIGLILSLNFLGSKFLVFRGASAHP